MFGQFNQKAEFKPNVIAKSAETKEKITRLIEKSILFANLNREDLAIVVDAMK